MNIKIDALIARKIGFASHQNAVPLVRELSLWNQEETTLEDLVLTLSTTRDGKDANAVQAQVREALDKAVLVARGAAEPGQMDVVDIAALGFS